jgi:NitT/TauT family transport system substrate-binding protein
LIRKAPLCFLLLTIWVLSACQSGYAGKVEFVTIGTAPLESSALIYIADNQGLFANNGINVTIRDYDTGAAALDGLVNGEVDIAVPAEYALVGKAFNKDKIRALASIDKAQYFYLVARHDRGIAGIMDLKGKKIGVVRKTIAEFYLGRLLELHGLTAGQVTLVDVSVAQSEAAIQSGNIDAIISRPPYVSPVEERLGANAVVWPAQSNQALYAILIGRNDWIIEHPERIRRLYRSLIQADEYLINHSAEAKAIVQKRLNLDDAYMAAVWSQNQFSLSLDQSLILAMEDEARWMIANNLTTEKQVPNFLDYVHEDGLKAIKPQAVNVIR